MALDTINTCNINVLVQADVYKNVTGFQSPIHGQVNIANNKTLTLGTSAGQCNEIFSKINTIAASGTLNLDLSGVLADITNNVPASQSRIIAIMVELLSAAQDTVNGTACSSVTLGAAGSNPWIGGPFGATDTYKINNGGCWLHTDFSAAGLAVTAATADILKILNNDAGVAAAVRVTIFGN